jgi:hypothetical protein
VHEDADDLAHRRAEARVHLGADAEMRRRVRRKGRAHVDEDGLALESASDAYVGAVAR